MSDSLATEMGRPVFVPASIGTFPPPSSAPSPSPIPGLPFRVLDPLTQAERDRLVELTMPRALTPAEQEEVNALGARAHLAGKLEPPDPELARVSMDEALAHLVAIVEAAVAQMPMLHGLAGRAAAMRAAFDRAVFHAAPETPPPPPARDEARVAVLKAIPSRTPAEEEELRALTA